MLKTLTLLTILTANVVIASILPTDDVPSLLKRVHTIVALGDSITQGGGGPGGYVRLLQENLTRLYPDQHIKVINSGIGGNKATDMQDRFVRDVLNHKPDLVTISVGVNDVWHGFYDNHPNGDGPRAVGVDLYRQKLIEMVDAAQAKGIKVVLLTPTLIYENLDSPENKKMDGHIQTMREVASEKRCSFINLNEPFHKIIAEYQKRAGKDINLLTSDGVHMNGPGNRVMAFNILKGLGIPAKKLEMMGQSK